MLRCLYVLLRGALSYTVGMPVLQPCHSVGEKRLHRAAADDAELGQATFGVLQHAVCGYNQYTVLGLTCVYTLNYGFLHAGRTARVSKNPLEIADNLGVHIKKPS